MKMLRTNFLEKQGKERREMKTRVSQHRKEMKVVEHIRQKKEKERRKKILIKRSKQEKIKENKR